MRRIFLAICYVGLIAGVLAFALKAKKVPNLVVSPKHCDLGYVEPGIQVPFVISLENRGQDFLIIKKITTSCSCTMVEDIPKSIKPGGKILLNASIYPKRSRENKLHELLIIESNDPKSGVIQIPITAFNMPKIDIGGDKIDLKVSSERSSNNITRIPISIRRDIVIQSISVRSNQEAICLGIDKSDPDKQVLEISLPNPDGYSGNIYADAVIVATLLSGEEIKQQFKVQMVVDGDIKFHPKAVFFMQGVESSKQKVFVTSKDNRKLKIVECRVAKVKESSIGAVNYKNNEIEVSIKNGIASGSREENLMIVVNDRGKLIKLVFPIFILGNANRR